MTVTRRLLKPITRLNAVYPWDHDAHYHRWILRQLPGRVGTALDVGCGKGELALPPAPGTRRGARGRRPL